MNLDEPAENQQLLTLVDGLTSSALRSPRCGTGGIEESVPPASGWAAVSYADARTLAAGSPSSGMPRRTGGSSSQAFCRWRMTACSLTA
jgi:hypothetical protein